MGDGLAADGVIRFDGFERFEHEYEDALDEVARHNPRLGAICRRQRTVSVVVYADDVRSVSESDTRLRSDRARAIEVARYRAERSVVLRLTRLAEAEGRKARSRRVPSGRTPIAPRVIRSRSSRRPRSRRTRCASRAGPGRLGESDPEPSREDAGAVGSCLRLLGITGHLLIRLIGPVPERVERRFRRDVGRGTLGRWA